MCIASSWELSILPRSPTCFDSIDTSWVSHRVPDETPFSATQRFSDRLSASRYCMFGLRTTADHLTLFPVSRSPKQMTSLPFGRPSKGLRLQRARAFWREFGRRRCRARLPHLEDWVCVRGKRGLHFLIFPATRNATFKKLFCYSCQGEVLHRATCNDLCRENLQAKLAPRSAASKYARIARKKISVACCWRCVVMQHGGCDLLRRCDREKWSWIKAAMLHGETVFSWNCATRYRFRLKLHRVTRSFFETFQGFPQHFHAKSRTASYSCNGAESFIQRRRVFHVPCCTMQPHREISSNIISYEKVSPCIGYILGVILRATFGNKKWCVASCRSTLLHGAIFPAIRNVLQCLLLDKLHRQIELRFPWWLETRDKQLDANITPKRPPPPMKFFLGPHHPKPRLSHGNWCCAFRPYCARLPDRKFDKFFQYDLNYVVHLWVILISIYNTSE